MPALVEAGISVIICNRPDSEIPADRQSGAIRAAAEAAGIGFVDNPVTYQTITPERLDVQREVLDRDDAKVLAYCKTGTRSTVLWAMVQATSVPVDDIMSAAEAAGYQLAGLRPQLEVLAPG